MNEVKLEKEKQIGLKRASKAVYIIAKIAKVLVIIGIIFAIFGMTVAIFCASKVNVKNNETIEINFDDSVIEFTEDNGTILFKANNDSTVINDNEAKDIFKKVVKIYQENSKNNVIAFLVVQAIFSVAAMILLELSLKRLESLFKNIHDGDTPFTLENVEHVKKLSYLMVSTTIVPMIGNFFSGFFIREDFGIDINIGFSIIYILVVYSLGHIFEYGYNIQQDSTGRIYGDENE